MEREGLFHDQSCSLGNVQKHVILHYVVRASRVDRSR